MYRAIELARSDRYLHRFVWRSNPNVPLTDHRMTCVTFGVSSSLFAANMAVKQNAIDHAQEFPFAAEIARKCFYVDDCLTGADDPKSALTLQQQLTSLFARGGFGIPANPPYWRKSPRNSRDVQTISEINEYTKTLGIESTDEFRLTIAEPSPNTTVTKRVIVSDVAKIFDVLGWFSPVTVKMKILLQRLWEIKLDWDDPIPDNIYQVRSQWRSEVPLLHVPPVLLRMPSYQHNCTASVMPRKMYSVDDNISPSLSRTECNPSSNLQ